MIKLLVTDKDILYYPFPIERKERKLPWVIKRGYKVV